MKLCIIKGSPVPLYFQIAEAIEEEVRLKNIPSGHQIATESQLTRDLAVSHGTVRHALQLLEKKNIITRIQGSGTYVV